MKLNQIKTIGDLMYYCKMPYYYQAEIKKMKVGDIFFLGQYRKPIENSEDEYVAEAWIEKHRGLFGFYGTWTFPTCPRRGLIMTYGKFKIHKSKIDFIEVDHNKSEVKLFSLICRYLNAILSSFSSDERMFYLKKRVSPLLMGTRIDKNFIGYQRLYNPEKRKFYFINYEACAPTHQLMAIVSVAISLGVVSTEA